jgi:ribosomal-protein-alanine N-acetyltransferase
MSGTIDEFRTPRLVAVRLQPAHLPDYARLFQNPAVMATLSPDGQTLSDEEVARWLTFSLEHWDRHGFGFCAFFTRDDQKFVGRAGLKQNTIDGKSVVELGYALLPEYWGQGFATEMATAIASRAFEQLGIPELVCYTLSTNRASRRVMEKTGFKFERETEHVGLPHVFYRLTASEFLPAT